MFLPYYLQSKYKDVVDRVHQYRTEHINPREIPRSSTFAAIANDIGMEPSVVRTMYNHYHNNIILPSQDAKRSASLAHWFASRHLYNPMQQAALTIGSVTILSGAFFALSLPSLIATHVVFPALATISGTTLAYSVIHSQSIYEHYCDESRRKTFNAEQHRRAFPASELIREAILHDTVDYADQRFAHHQPRYLVDAHTNRYQSAINRHLHQAFFAPPEVMHGVIVGLSLASKLLTELRERSRMPSAQSKFGRLFRRNRSSRREYRDGLHEARRKLIEVRNFLENAQHDGIVPSQYDDPAMAEDIFRSVVKGADLSNRFVPPHDFFSNSRTGFGSDALHGSGNGTSIKFPTSTVPVVARGL
jgi:hypothetical protein